MGLLALVARRDHARMGWRPQAGPPCLPHLRASHHLHLDRSDRHALLLLPLPRALPAHWLVRATLAASHQHRRHGHAKGRRSPCRRGAADGEALMRRLTLALLGAALVAFPVVAQQQQKQQAPEAAQQSSPQAESEPTLPKHAWSFDGPFGTYDRASVQRGFQIYSEVCSQCHSMNLLHYRDLGPNGPGGGVGYSEEEVK